jgi:hypothetical protein
VGGEVVGIGLYLNIKDLTVGVCSSVSEENSFLNI